MEQTPYRLVRLTAAMAAPFAEMLQDYLSEPNSRYIRDLALIEAGFDGYVKHLDEEAVALNPSTGRVPYITYWLQNDREELLGGIRIRPLLNPILAHEAGHIGYDIRPSRRGQGLGTTQLGLALPICRELNLDHVLVTCRRDNPASARVIEKSGGVLENEVLSWIHPDVWFKRYWIRIFDLVPEHR
ncbi:MAG: GNAT family N-acetyltransferase [Anaerolineae bacterium]